MGDAKSGFDDGIALENKAIQNLPLPSAFKGAANTATSDMISTVNDSANFITNTAPHAIENVVGSIIP